MSHILRQRRSSKESLAEELTRRGLEVFLPCTPDPTVDLIVRQECGDGTHYYEMEVRDQAKLNVPIRVSDPADRQGNYVLVVHRDDDGASGFIYLTSDQVSRLLGESSTDGLLLREADRIHYASQTIDDLARRLVSGEMMRRPTRDQIQHVALRHVVWKLGDAIRVGRPRWVRGEWAVDLFSPDGENLIGELYYSADGELITAKSATYESLRGGTDAARPQVPST